MKKYGVFIGRFQPVHNAHLEIIKTALEDCERALIVVGSYNTPPTIKNPWTFDQRVQMLKRAILEYHGEPVHRAWEDRPGPSILDRVDFVRARDYLYNDYKWVSEIQSLVLDMAPEDAKVRLYGCYKDDSSYYLEMFPQWKVVSSPYLWQLNGTDVRREMFEGNSVGSMAERLQTSTVRFMNEWVLSDQGQYLVDEFNHYRDYTKAWEAAPYAPTFVTVDSVVLKAGCILLIKRKFHPGKGLWALPGGFLSAAESIQKSAIRELREESRIMVPVPDLERALQSVHVFDHPHRSLRGRTITHVHVFDLGKTGQLPSVKGGDDASGAHWVPLAEFFQLEREMFEDHYSIIYQLVANH